MCIDDLIKFNEGGLKIDDTLERISLKKLDSRHIKYTLVFFNYFLLIF
jgi:hypothetical protein